MVNLSNMSNSAAAFQYGESINFDAEETLTDMDFNLIWPDSEDLFQSIFSSDVSASWQLPPGTLPLPSAAFGQVGASFISPNNSSSHHLTAGGGFRTSDNEVRTTDNQMPSDDNQVAVHGVSQMVSSLSASLTAAVESKSITSVFLDECLHMYV